tara:strand:+ start:42271 stop:42507 length:237 start_codon:yes stop_codon:yes gene_type:complete
MTAAELKEWMLAGAEVVDAWRAVPRALMAGYAFLVYDLTVWYQLLDDPSSSQQWVLSTVWGAAALITKFYLESGRKWA